MRSQIAALAIALSATIAAPLAVSAQPYGGYHGGMMGHHGNFRQAHGRISSVQGSSFTMDNGRTVFLKPGTQINGGHIRAGRFVTVTGTGAGNANINAQTVTLQHR